MKTGLLPQHVSEPITKLEDFFPPARNPHHGTIRQKLLEILASKGQLLPTAESPLGKLWTLLHSPNVDLYDCASVIQLDPALTVSIFRVVNSAAFGGKKMSNIPDAVLRLGFAPLRDLVFGSGVMNHCSDLVMPAGWEDFWLRNILIARLTERISDQYFRTDGSEYLAGLLHDASLPFLSTFFPDEFDTLFGNEQSYLELERIVLPAKHEQIAAGICFQSLLPARVVQAVALHHTVPLIELSRFGLRQSPEFLAALIFISDLLADSCLPIAGNTALSIQEIEETDEYVWLKQFGALSLGGLIDQELPKANEIYASISGK